MGVKDYLRLITYFLPLLLSYALPLAALMASLFLFMRLVQDKELLALESLGLSFEKLLRPVFLFSIITLIITYFITLSFIPWSKHAYRTFLFELTKRKIENGIPAKTFVPITNGLTMFVKKSWEKGKNFAIVFILDETQKGQKGLIFAKKGWFTLKDDILELHLDKGSVHLISKDYSSVQEIEFQKYVYRTRLKELKATRTPSRGEMSLKELKEKTISLPPNDPKRAKYITEYYRRLAFPWAAFFLPILGAYLGSMIKTSGRVTGGVVAVILYLGYYFLQSLGISLAETQKLSPLMASNIPNIFLILVLTLLFWATKKRLIRPY